MLNQYEYFLLHETNEKFYIDPSNENRTPLENNNFCLVIDRFSGDINILPRTVLPYSLTDKLIFGIFGIINLITGKYLIVITKRKLVATINGEQIYAIESTEILPYIPPHQVAKPIEDIRENQIYYQMLQTFLDFRHFYFSPSYDLTHNMQFLQNTDADFRHLSMLERADQRFVWNGHMLKDLKAVERAELYTTPVMLGFIGALANCQINGKQFQLTLISRRSIYRAGVRFYARGLDLEGNAANFVEIEQIIEHDSYVASLVQIRGSIPLFWTQKPNLERLPRPKIRMDLDHAQAFRRHIQISSQYYDRMLILSLISKSGHEKQLADALEQLCSQAGENIQFLAFDFHKECRNLDWSKLKALMTDLDKIIVEYGYFCYQLGNPEPDFRQTGTVRANCIDCLDRTNVVQSLIANKSLEYQFKHLKILSSTDALSEYKDFAASFNALWADNGDYLSIHYAGTGALKADFTRTGTRTKMGLVNDGLNTGRRYYINNFLDGFRQDAIDFALGNVVLDEREYLKQKLNEWEWRHYIGILLLFVSSMFLLSLLVSTDYTFCYGWGFISVLVLAYAYYAGEQIVCRPKLKFD